MNSFSFGRRLAAAVAAATSLVAFGAAEPAQARPALKQAQPALMQAEVTRQTEDMRLAEYAQQAGDAAGDGRIKVMPLGDSITWGVGSASEDSYRGALFWRLNAAGVSIDYVGSMRSGSSPDPDNEGHKGWTIAQLADKVDEWLGTYRPDVILLHIGTNDMVRGVQDAPQQLDALLDRIAGDLPDAQVFVATIVGLGDYADTAAQRFRTARFNAAIPEIVAAKGPRFHLVDQGGIHGIDMWNREHPNDYGYQKMAWNWYRAMERALTSGGGDPWPAADNPYRAAFGSRCIQRSTLGRVVQGCHTWYHRDHVWQLPVRTKVRYRAKIDGKIVTRVRIVTRWVTAG